MTNELTLIYVIFGSWSEAQDAAKHLLSQKLIACANIWEIDSLYTWQDKIQENKEFVLLGKTTMYNYQKVETEIKQIHSFEVPCIIKVPAEAEQVFNSWVHKVVKS